MKGLVSFSEALLVLVAAAAAGVACYVAATSLGGWPPYRASATLIIDETPDGDAQGVSAEGIAIAQTTMAALIKREPLISDVASELQIGIDGEELANRLQIDLPENAPLVEVSATHGDRDTAVRIANTVVAAAANLETPLTGGSVLSEAEAPTRPVISSYLIVFAAAVVGGLLGVGGVLLGRSLSDQVRDLDDVSANTNLPIIGQVRLDKNDGNHLLQDRILLASLGQRLRADGHNLVFASPTVIMGMTDLVRMQLDVLSQGSSDNEEEPVVNSEEEAEPTDSEDLDSVPSDGSARDDGIDLDLSAEPMKSKATITQRVDGLILGTPHGSEKQRLNGTEASEVAVSVVPALLGDFSFLDQVTSKTRLVVVAEVNTTRKSDLRAASDAVQQVGRVRPGVLLVG